MIKSCLLRIKLLSKKTFSTVTGDGLPSSYSTGVQVMHWGMGGSMMACVGLVLAAQNTKDKKAKGDFMYYHKSFGTLAFALLFPRLAIKLASKSPGPIEGAGTIEILAAKVSHYVMYGFIAFLPISGVVMGMFSGFGLPFFFKTIPSIEKKPEYAKPAYEYHKLAGSAFEYFVPIHVGGAFFHVLKGQTIFPRILGVLKQTPK